MTEIKNAVLGTAKKPYEKLDVQAPLLAASFGSGAGINSVGRGSWDDEE